MMTDSADKDAWRNHSFLAEDAALKRAHMADHLATGVFYVVTGCFVLLLIAVTCYVIYGGIRALDPSILSFSPDGIGNQFFNTCYLVFLSLLVSVPIGVAAGVYMSEYAPQVRVTQALRMAIETLSSLPSIVVGLFGYLVFIVMTNSQWNLFSGALAVSILCLPLITSTTYDALRSLPPGYKEGSLALGATHWETIWHVLLPASIGPIMTGVILAAGRGFGEAAALLYTAGMSTDINWHVWNLASPVCPFNPFRPGETLSLVVWSARTEGISGTAADTAAMASAVLMIMVLIFSIGARLFSRYITKKDGRRSIMETNTLTEGGFAEAENAAVIHSNISFTCRNENLFYGKFQALKNVSLTLERNRITALIGPSGCGKSTFLRSLNRMNDLIPGCRVEGEIYFNGVNIYKDIDPIVLRRHVGMVFQQPNPFPKSVYDNVAYGPRLMGITKKKELDEIVESSLRQAAIWDELKDRLDKSALGLSGGQQQRLCIARVLAVRPEVLLMDEATSALDPISTSKIEELAVQLKEKYTVIIVTHNMQQARRIADKTAFFYLGEMVEYGDTAEIFEHPKKERTARYVSGHFG